MKTSIAILALLGAVSARHHHHHTSLAQGDTNGAGGSNPVANRKAFEKDVAAAAAVVASEKSSENQRTTTHAGAMASQYQATYDKNAATRTKRVVEGVENNVAHKQWVTRNNRSNWAQTSEPWDYTVGGEGMNESVHDFVTDGAVDDASVFAQVSAPAVTPDSNRASFEAAKAKAAQVVNAEKSSEASRTSTHAAAMASQYKATYDKNAATRTKHNILQVENNVAHRQWVTRNNRSNWAQTSSPGDSQVNAKGMDPFVHDFIIDESPDHESSRFAQISADPVTPDSNRASFEAAVAKAASVVNAEKTSEASRTSTHAAAMASQYKATYDKNAATRTKHNVEQVENNVAHRQWVTRNNRSNWAQVSAPGDRTIGKKGLDPRVAALLSGGDEDSNEISREFVQYDSQNQLWRMI